MDIHDLSLEEQANSWSIQPYPMEEDDLKSGPRNFHSISRIKHIRPVLNLHVAWSRIVKTGLIQVQSSLPIKDSYPTHRFQYQWAECIEILYIKAVWYRSSYECSVVLGTEEKMMSLPKLFRVATKLLPLFMAVPMTILASPMCNVNSSALLTSYNASANYLGCYLDPSVTILTAAKLSTVIMTPQYCANWCGERGFAYGGVEFGT
ncbi:hypothetical protein F5884DRAFT_812990 [Xylogone sp. PMI_703]|nr:hypothetical protein F5884DRAFT_812990 [Xylogone sp. PMI_703]